MARLAALITLLGLTTFIWADSRSYWQDVSEAQLRSPGAQRTVYPNQYRTLSLNVEALELLLDEIPEQVNQQPQDQSSASVLALPHPDGKMQYFRVWRSNIMAPELAAKFPEINAYRGEALDGSGARLSMDLTSQGLHAMVRHDGGSWFIDPYQRGERSAYLSYHRADLPAPRDGFNFHPPVKSKEITAEWTGNVAEKARGDQLSTYRLAVAATGEYTQYHGGTVADAQAAIVTSINRVAGIYEDELAISFQLVANNDAVVFTDATTDPYTNDSGFAMLSENQQTLDDIIEPANYDIGHVFSTGGGGVASFQSVCLDGQKASGVTGSPAPVGDAFNVDYVAHEIGHQFGGAHTFDGNAGSCSGGNRVDSAAFEPGSGTTIMAYAGICSPQNIQNNSDAYFHTHSFEQISAFVGSGGGSTCDDVSNLTNSAPNVNAGVGGMTIPASTPFMLQGSASDPDADNLRFRWEQHDLRAGGSGAPPSDTSNNAPIFRSFTATGEPVRVFPQLSDLLNNTQTMGEVLPPDSRSLSFRLTALDDNVGGGGLDYDEVTYEVSATAGPFLVTEPNTAVNWTGGSAQSVTWDVANTDLAPVNCSQVDIDLSDDGGVSFDTPVLSATPNDGSATVIVPTIASSQVRLRVRCSDNIFFDVSDVDFTVAAGADDFSVAVSSPQAEACETDTIDLDVAVGQIGSFSELVTLSASGHGGNASFSINNQVPPYSSLLQLSNPSAGELTVTVTGSAGSANRQDSVALSVQSALAVAPDFLSPADNAIVSDFRPTLSWAGVNGASSYRVAVIAAGGSFASPLWSAQTTDTSLSIPAGMLSAEQSYDWRVTAINSCGEQTATARRFSVAALQCETMASTDVPQPISASGPQTVVSTLAFDSDLQIADINLLGLDITHTYISDLSVSLQSPAGTSQEIMSNSCENQDNILISFDDEADPGAWPCPPTGGTYRPSNSLSTFDDESSAGIWQLTISDDFDQDGGSLNAWSLEVCTLESAPPPSGPIFADRFEEL